jgi:hypothetical protein
MWTLEIHDNNKLLAKPIKFLTWFCNSDSPLKGSQSEDCKKSGIYLIQLQVICNDNLVATAFSQPSSENLVDYDKSINSDKSICYSFAPKFLLVIAEVVDQEISAKICRLVEMHNNKMLLIHNDQPKDHWTHRLVPILPFRIIWSDESDEFKCMGIEIEMNDYKKLFELLNDLSKDFGIPGDIIQEGCSIIETRLHKSGLI